MRTHKKMLEFKIGDRVSFQPDGYPIINGIITKHNTTLYETHGVVMKEYVTIPNDLLKNTNELKIYLSISYGYTKSLKPKPTKKRK